MNFVKDVLENVWVQRAFWALIVILFNVLLYRLVTRFLTRKEKKTSRIISDKKNKTILRMIKSITAGVLSVVTILTILQIYGVDVTSMLAGVGIASIVIGFALQDSLKDIIRGFNIVSDNYYEIGDVIKFGDNVGQVTSVSLLTTKIQDINTNNTVSIANRNIDQVEVDNGYIYLPVPLPYELKVEKAEPIMRDIAKKLSRHEKITSIAYQGITKLDSSSLNYQFVITCDPAIKPSVRREALHVIVTTLEEQKISIPYPQMDLHTKK